MKILVAVDGSPFTKRMLGYLAAHDEWLGGAHQYTVLHSVPAVPPRAAAVIDKATLKAYYDEEAEKVLKPIRTFFSKKRDLRVDFAVKSGPAADNWKSYLDKVPIDPWGKPYQYLNPGIKGEIDVYSFGADGQAGGTGVDADVGSWGL